MAIALRPRHLGRYRAIAHLLMKYGRSDLVRQAGLDAALGDRPALDQEAMAAEAAQLTDDLEAMGPTFVKLGQLLSTRSDLVPPAYLEALSRLQDRVEPFGYDEVVRQVTEQLGVRISDAFATFDPKPLASASLGQVHRAAMRDGRPVVVKVQRPGIRTQVAEDLEVLTELAEFLDDHTDTGRRYGFTDLVEQFSRSITAELDYQLEAANLVRLRRIVERYDRLVVPAPIPDYSTTSILTMEFIAGRKVTDLGPLGLMELDGAPLADQLFKAYLDQVLVEGFFHADPHPGNVLLTPEHNLALIDVGMVARVPRSMREGLIKLLLALSDSDGPGAAEAAVALGSALEGFDRSAFCSQAAELVDRADGLRLGQLDAGTMVMQLMRISGENGLRLPAELSMLGKALLNLDQVAHRLDPDFKPLAAMKEHSAAIMQSQMRASSGGTFSAMLELRDFVEELPGRVNKVMDALAEGEFHVNVKAFDEAELLRGLQKLANRLTMGLVMAALIVGAAMLMRVPTSSQLFGYPSIAIVCFLAAAAGGGLLLLSIIRSDQRVNAMTKRQKSRPRSRAGPLS
jgi:ubiquinone biosynthesis protein